MKILEIEILFDIKIITDFHQFFENTDYFDCANQVILEAGKKLSDVINIASQ